MSLKIANKKITAGPSLNQRQGFKDLKILGSAYPLRNLRSARPESMEPNPSSASSGSGEPVLGNTGGKTWATTSGSNVGCHFTVATSVAVPRHGLVALILYVLQPLSGS